MYKVIKYSAFTSVNLVTSVVYVGVGAASMAKLTFMVGGPEEEYQAAQELLTCMGANVVYCGQVGTGQVRTCKLALLLVPLLHTVSCIG